MRFNVLVAQSLGEQDFNELIYYGSLTILATYYNSFIGGYWDLTELDLENV